MGCSPQILNITYPQIKVDRKNGFDNIKIQIAHEGSAL
jgi:hypothetical protein